jgi:hypothetical protein
MVKGLIRELTGMFAGEGRLSAAVLVIVAAAGIMVEIAGADRLAGGAVLLFGCLGLLVASVCRAARAKAARTGTAEPDPPAAGPG